MIAQLTDIIISQAGANVRHRAHSPNSVLVARGMAEPLHCATERSAMVLASSVTEVPLKEKQTVVAIKNSIATSTSFSNSLEVPTQSSGCAQDRVQGPTSADKVRDPILHNRNSSGAQSSASPCWKPTSHLTANEYYYIDQVLRK